MAQTALRLVEEKLMDKNKALEAAVAQIERAHGKGSVMRLGQRESAVNAEAVSTGSLGLDMALGIGGLPRGRVNVAECRRRRARRTRTYPRLGSGWRTFSCRNQTAAMSVCALRWC